MKAPFVWFGGKSRVAAVVWDALGDVTNYVEPFAGSLAVLLGRPLWHEGSCETVNDMDRFVSNFWRALAKSPDEVAEHADWPVNEADLLARHLWLVNAGGKGLAEKLEGDPEWFDAKAAGWWVWGLNQWIGSGWCSGEGPWVAQGGDVHRQLPNLGDEGRGVHRKLPHLGDEGRGVMPRNEALLAYLRDLAHRLRRVRVCCGDWSRVVTDGALSFGGGRGARGEIGIFLDPPYLGSVRTEKLYASDDHHVANAVREWALKNGDNPKLRIVLAGYAPEHEHLMPPSWRVHAYKGRSCFKGGGEGGQNVQNRELERLWFSPHCLQPQRTLFSGVS